MRGRGPAHRGERSGAGGACKQSGRAGFLPFPLPRGPVSGSKPGQSPSLWGDQDSVPLPVHLLPGCGAPHPPSCQGVHPCPPWRRASAPEVTISSFMLPGAASGLRFPRWKLFYAFSPVSRAGRCLSWGFGHLRLCRAPGREAWAWQAAISRSGKHRPAKASWQIIELNLLPSAFLLSVPACWCSAFPSLALRQQ